MYTVGKTSEILTSFWYFVHSYRFIWTILLSFMHNRGCSDLPKYGRQHSSIPRCVFLFLTITQILSRNLGQEGIKTVHSAAIISILVYTLGYLLSDGQLVIGFSFTGKFRILVKVLLQKDFQTLQKHGVHSNLCWPYSNNLTSITG